MPVNYKLIQRTNLRDKTKPGKYYAIPIIMNKITMDDIGREIGRRTTIKMPVLVGVLEALNEVIPEFLSQGHVVELGKVGNLRISFSSEGVDKPEDFRKSHIKKVNVQYRPGKDIKNKIQKIELKKIR